jgi:pimeloyl-ACP methyl ester carboxylesterase/DNA-binding SARP family transcriptional activator
MVRTRHLDLRLAAYPEVWLGGRPATLKLKRGLAALAYLAETGRKVSRDRLAELLWPDTESATGRTRLRRLCHEVNGALAMDLLKGDTDAVWLAPEGGAVASDVGRVRAAAMQMLTAPDRAEARASLDLLCAPRATSVLDGFSIDSDVFEAWLSAHRAQQERLVLRALSGIAQVLLQTGQPRLAADAAAAMARLDPFAEAGHALLLQSHAQLGDAGAVESAYFACADLLRRELGIRPSARIESTYASAVARLAAAPEDQVTDPVSMPPIRFAETADGVVAFLEIGAASAPCGTLLILFGAWSHLEVAWEEPCIRSTLQRLATRFRVALVDRRGLGLSERVAHDNLTSSGAQDVEAVRRCLGEQQIWLFGNSMGGSVAIEYAATHPQHVQGLVLYAAGARGTWAPHYPWAPTEAQLEDWRAKIRLSWGAATSLEQFAPSMAEDESAKAWWARMMRQSASRDGLTNQLGAFAKVDVCQHLPQIKAQTLVIQREGDRIVRAGASRYVSEQIPGACLAMLPGSDHLMWFGDTDAVISQLERFADTRDRGNGNGNGNGGADNGDVGQL